MTERIRHSVECPKCHTRYLIGFSPYRNRSYLVSEGCGSSQEYTLYCSCRRPSVVSRWRLSEVSTCEVSNTAYRRGYGTIEEVVPVRHLATKAWRLDIARYLNLKPIEKDRRVR